jgi:hypothetical protein
MYTSFRWLLLSLSVAAAAVCLTARPAGAQTFGVRVGASADPDQFVLGGHFETEPIVERITFRPNIELGLGNGLTVTCFNFELAYKFDSSRPWHVYAGGGPALVLINSERRDHAEGGFNILLGIEHRAGLFGEIKAGALDSPDFKILIGYVFH